MKKQRWLSLVLILALVVGLCSVCAAAADDQTAEQPAQEAAYTVILCFSLFKTGSLAKSIFHAH